MRKGSKFFLAFAQDLGLGDDLGHVHTFDENTIHLPIGTAHRLVDKIQYPLFRFGTQRGNQADRRGTAGMGLAGLVDLVEQFEETLALHFRQGYAHRQADHHCHGATFRDM